MTRAEIIDSLLARLGAPEPAAGGEKLFNPALAQALALDPAAMALLPDMRLPMAVDSGHPELFRLTPRGTLLVSPALLSRPAALGVVVRWAQESTFFMQIAGADPQRRARAQAAAARHGAALLARLPEAVRADLRLWLPGNGEAAPAPAAAAPDADGGELALPVEALLELGGDARIVASPATGMNRYGATSRPRPEAVHFSSSTASSVSDYTFAALDRLRRAWLVRGLFDDNPSPLGTPPLTPCGRGAGGEGSGRRNTESDPSSGASRHLLPQGEKGIITTLADALRREILALLALDEAEADVILAPSGTDTELLAVLLALGADPRLANILIAPEETGRSVATAAAGRAFSGDGQVLWPEADIGVSSVGVRDSLGRPLPDDEVEREVAEALQTALAARPRALLHVLIGSKTGISAPSPAFVAVLGAPSQLIDVVADGCQWRVAGETLGDRVRDGWMAQISGSKFLTGPPFSGALVVPTSFRARRESVAKLWAQAPDIAPAPFWPPAWREAFPQSAALASFGPLFRWAGALVEAKLFAAAPLDLARRAFDAFCAEMRERLARCRLLVELEPPHPTQSDAPRDFADFAGSSIICFAPSIDDGAGSLRRLDAAESEVLFRCLNADLSGLLPNLDPLESALARQPCHIGQPVDLTPGSKPPNVILRLVIGARFFSTIAMAGERADAALDAEIADALRAVDKAELILARWRGLGE